MSRPIQLSSEHYNPQPGYSPTSSLRSSHRGSRRGDRELNESMARMRLAPDEAQMYNLYNKVQADAYHPPAPRRRPTINSTPTRSPSSASRSHVLSESSPTIKRTKAIMRRPGQPKRTKSKQKTVRYVDEEEDPYDDLLDDYYAEGDKDEEESEISSDVTTSTQTSNEDYYLDMNNRESRKHFEALRELDDYVRERTVEDGRSRPVPMSMQIAARSPAPAPAPSRAPLSYGSASSESSAGRMPPPQPRRNQSTRNGSTRPLNLPVHKLSRAAAPGVGNVSGSDSDKTLVSDTPPRPTAATKAKGSLRRNPKENPLLIPLYPINESGVPPSTAPQEFFKDPYRRPPDGHEMACYAAEPTLQGRGHERQRPISRPRREEVGSSLDPELARRLQEWHKSPQTELDLRAWDHAQEKRIRRGVNWFFLGQRMEHQRQNPWNRPDPPVAKHAFGM